MDAADVPLQRLVLPLGRDRRRRDARVPAMVEPALIWRLFKQEGSPTTTARRRCRRPRPPSRRRQARAAGHRLGRGCPALADAARAHGGAQHPGGARVRADRDLRAAHGVRVARGLGRATAPSAPAAARQGGGTRPRDPVRVVDEQMRDVPRDGETMGEVVMRGNNVMLGYYRDPAGTAEGFRRRLVSLRRPRP